MEKDSKWHSESVFALQKCPSREQVKTVTYAPLAMLYVEMVRKGELTPIVDLDEATKRKYWNETQGSLFMRKIFCQALYVYDLINQ